MAESDNPEPVGAFIEINLSEADEKDLIDHIRLIDATDTQRFLADDVALQGIKDWATKPIIAKEDGVKFKGKTYKKGEVIRGPLAESLEEYYNEPLRSISVRWVTVLDANTGRLDRSLDGKVFDLNDPSTPLPPLHPNCRCTLEPIPEDDKGIYKNQ